MNRIILRCVGWAGVWLLLAGCAAPEKTPLTSEAAMSAPEPATPLPNFDEMWDYNDPQGTEAQFRALIPRAEAARAWPYLAELLTQVARTEGLQRQFDQAQRTLDTAENMIRERESVAQVRLLLERGRVFNSAGTPEKAEPLFRAAWELARELDADFHAVDAAHMLGIVERGDAALAWNERAMEAAEASTDPRARNWLGSLYNNTGWTYHDQGEYERALALFEKALAFREEQGDARSIRIARWCVARCQRSLGRLDEALALQRQLAAEHAAAGSNDGYVQEELGECLLALGDAAAARPHFAAAHAALSQDPWLVANEPERLARLAELAE